MHAINVSQLAKLEHVYIQLKDRFRIRFLPWQRLDWQSNIGSCQKPGMVSERSSFLSN